MSRYNYSRRSSRTVTIGGVGVGGDNPVRLQSMTNTATLDTEASARQIAEIAAAGGEIVRLTTQGEREAANMKAIEARIHEWGIDVPLVADVHFNPKAAYVAAANCEKVRINPGNFVDPGRTFRHIEYTDDEYAAEQRRIAQALLPLLDICRRNRTALRLGVNHGSLSDRIMSRYGDTPEGMAESALEFLRICKADGFDDVVISIKSSNTAVMVATVRLLARAMTREGMDYPLHLGVTEAGDGEDGRIKSATGIGTLLAEGLGDTIRVSLSEPPANEIPVAALLRDYICSRAGHSAIPEPESEAPFPARKTAETPADWPVVASVHADSELFSGGGHHADASQTPLPFGDLRPVILTSRHRNPVGEMQSWIERFIGAGGRNPIVLSLDYGDADSDKTTVMAAADMGTMLVNGYGSAIEVKSGRMDSPALARLELSILQAARLRFTKTEYIACPGCGRTLFDLQSTLQHVRRATSHLKGLKIGVMGCIVNGPGEMADADYGYVGAGPGRVSIYKGKKLMVKNIPAEDALAQLKRIISDNGDWSEPSPERQ